MSFPLYSIHITRFIRSPVNGQRAGLGGKEMMLDCVAGADFFATLYFQQHRWVCFPLRSGLFFPQAPVFNNFSALFSGLFRFVFQARSRVFNNFSALFFKITSFFVPFVSKSHMASPFTSLDGSL